MRNETTDIVERLVEEAGMEYRLFLVHGYQNPIMDVYDEMGFPSALKTLEHEVGQASFNPDIIVTSEFSFKLDDILRNIQYVSELAERLGSDVILTPNNWSTGEGYTDLTQKAIIQMAESVGFTTGDVYDKDDFEPQAVSFLFGKNGEKFAVIKSSEEEGGQCVHSIPGRDYGISICYELWKNEIDPTALQGTEIIIHPAKQANFIYAKARTLYLGGTPLDEIRKMDEIYGLDVIDMNMLDIYSCSEHPLKRAGVRMPVVTCNHNPAGAGVVYMSDDWKVEHVEYTDTHLLLRLSKVPTAHEQVPTAETVASMPDSRPMYQS